MNSDVKTRKINYAEILKPGYTAAGNDQKVFNEYIKGEIDLRECFEWFMKNSKVGRVDESYWDKDQFKAWLRSLGYFSMKAKGE